jgi:competence ComEA-like helix-hairpin-helix protein
MFRFFTIIFAAFFWSWAALANVDVNAATESELTGLPGIGPAKAAAIVQHRTQHGPFTNLADLDAVSGIGPATLANITPLVTFSGKVDANAAVVPPAAGTAPTSSTGAVNINSADSSGLQNLPGIGPSKADAILADRTANGPFASCADLQRVRGVGPATVAGIQNVCITK